MLKVAQDARQKTAKEISIFEEELNEKMQRLTQLKHDFESIQQGFLSEYR